ncbi:MAG: hypothetical protein L3K15_05640 [Thermoplasmata archaeon]|nr:hypothetical protein [Thermoplasmata archaeon]
MASDRTNRLLVYVGVAALASLATLATVTAAGMVNWGHLLPSQQGTYHAPGTSHLGFAPLTVNNTSFSLPHNGSWYSIGFQTNATIGVNGFEVFLNVSGGNGSLTVYNLTAVQFGEVQNNQTFTYEHAWKGLSGTFIDLRSYVYSGQFFYVFMNTGSSALSVTYNLNVAPIH